MVLGNTDDLPVEVAGRFPPFFVGGRIRSGQESLKIPDSSFGRTEMRDGDWCQRAVPQVDQFSGKKLVMGNFTTLRITVVTPAEKGGFGCVFCRGLGISKPPVT